MKLLFALVPPVIPLDGPAAAPGGGRDENRRRSHDRGRARSRYKIENLIFPVSPGREPPRPLVPVCSLILPGAGPPILIPPVDSYRRCEARRLHRNFRAISLRSLINHPRTGGWAAARNNSALNCVLKRPRPFSARSPDVRARDVCERSKIGGRPGNGYLRGS